MRLLERLLGHDDDTTESDYDEELKHETAKIRAYRTAEEVAEASRRLMVKALELRAEIEAMTNE